MPRESYRRARRAVFHITVAALAAAVTPVAAAGLMQSVAMATGAVASVSEGGDKSIAPDDASGSATPNSSAERAATLPPRRLSPLAGNDTAAWEAAGRPNHKIKVH